MGFDAFLGSGLYGSAAQSQGTTSFADDAFRVTDDGEVTAKIAFQASAISSGTTRTILMPDADVDLGSLGGGGGLADLVDDTTPQLGGNLDLNGNIITSTGHARINLGDQAGSFEFAVRDLGGNRQFSVDSDGNVELSGTVDGRDVAADGTKLDAVYDRSKEVIIASNFNSGTTTQDRPCKIPMPFAGEVTKIELFQYALLNSGAGTDYWEVMVHNDTQGLDMLAAVKDLNSSAAILAGTTVDMGAMNATTANRTVAKDDYIKMVWTATGTPQNQYSSDCFYRFTITPA